MISLGIERILKIIKAGENKKIVRPRVVDFAEEFGGRVNQFSLTTLPLIQYGVSTASRKGEAESYYFFSSMRTINGRVLPQLLDKTWSFSNCWRSARYVRAFKPWTNPRVDRALYQQPQRSVLGDDGRSYVQ